MRGERWEQVKEIFHGALGLPDAERASYLESRCGDDPELRSEVESLLESASGGSAFLEKPALEEAARLMSEEKAASILGSELGNYKVLELIGAGGMGEVYLARDKRLGRKVALKLLPEYFTRDAERLRRFQREARAASALNHPNILTVYEIGESEGAHFIATEFIDGSTLRERIRAGTIAVGDAVGFALQTAEALAAAHEAGIIHRDIKPENIMVRRDGYVKVLDFGLAKLAEGAAAAEDGSSQISTQALVQTASGVVMGTALYMSPEQARGLEVDARTDIWSLGSVLYEMLAGRPPFEGETPSHVIVNILDKDVPPLSSKAKGAIPSELERVVMRALGKKREDRYGDAGEMVSALRAFRQRLSVEAALLQNSQQEAEEEQRTRELEARGASAPAADATGGEKVAHTGEAGAVTTGEARPAGEARQTGGAGQTAEATPAALSGARQRAGKGILWPGRGVAMAVGLGLLAFLVGFGLYWWLRPGGNAATAIPFSKTRLSKLTTNGKAGQAAVSPEGKYVVYVSGERGRQSLVLKHIPTGSDKEIVPVTGDDYMGPTFSRDGNYVYYRRAEKTQAVLYRVPVLGGVAPVKLAEDVDSAVTLSPDGKRFAFVRGYPQHGECALMVFNSDGTGEEKFLVKKGSSLFPFGSGGATFGPAWSPDGEMIAFLTRDSSGGKTVNRLKAVLVRDRAEKDLTSQVWTGIGQMTWRPDGGGLFMTAAEDSSGTFQQVWHVAYPSGEASRITNDLNNYFGVSLTADSSSLVTMQGERLSNVWVMTGGDAKSAAKVSSGKTDGDDGISWTPDGRIVYTSSTTGEQDLWIMNADGTGLKQLTRNTRRSSGPTVSPDGRYIVFASNRSGERRIWRMDIDGGNPLQLSQGKDDQYPFCTPDGKWVVYGDATTFMLWKVPIDGGQAVQITDYLAVKPSVSPDGKHIAIMFIDDQAEPKRYRMGIISIDGGKPQSAFDVRLTRGRFVWTPDSRSIIYMETEAGVTNLWSQPIDGGKPQKVTDFTSDQIFWFDYSKDGRQLAAARGTQTSDVVLITNAK